MVTQRCMYNTFTEQNLYYYGLPGQQAFDKHETITCVQLLVDKAQTAYFAQDFDTVSDIALKAIKALDSLPNSEEGFYMLIAAQHILCNTYNRHNKCVKSLEVLQPPFWGSKICRAPPQFEGLLRPCNCKHK